VIVKPNDHLSRVVIWSFWKMFAKNKMFWQFFVLYVLFVLFLAFWIILNVKENSVSKGLFFGKSEQNQQYLSKFKILV